MFNRIIGFVALMLVVWFEPDAIFYVALAQASTPEDRETERTGVPVRAPDT